MSVPGTGSPLRPLWWNSSARPGGALELIDQTLLPTQVATLTCTRLEQVWEAIKSLRVRGAPAIGVAAAYGVIVGCDEAGPGDAGWSDTVGCVCDRLSTSRPTAVNLFWALDRMRRRARELAGRPWSEARAALLAEAHAIRDEDAAMCRAIGMHGQHLVPEGGGVLTHCNAGALATSEYGTALAVMYAAHEKGRRFTVYADETRPLFQGARLTAWELTQAGIDATVICDSMAAVVMREKKVQVVVTGADRIASNGDTANKIGTYGVAVLARAHGIPFYVAAPSSTFDMGIADGSAIPIEHRDPEEVRVIGGRQVAPREAACYTPAFDVTPAELIAGIITEKGIIAPVTRENVARLIGG
ncbi:MAG: S-methyl-5-thioribose-1-phosphate isomerase [Planctomycetota bacterium]|nr:MAG: S-methyl-5-thioribose-1-phosphate isomerase [Planctomycetota bacterium]